MPEPTVPPPPAAGIAAPGRVLGGRYELAHLIARGGMADVWEGTDRLLERPVAIKVLHPHLAADADFVRRFRTEAVAAARLRHPGIVAIFDTCSEDGLEAIVMELVRGRTLRDQLDRTGPLTPAQAAGTGAAVADALHAAHGSGLVHRDVKPSNILLCDDGRVMITDFGIAKIRDTTDHTQVGTMLGSVKYLAPEQVEGEPVDGRTDVYALGVVLFEMLTGRVPFETDTPATTALARVHQDAPRVRTLRPEVPPAIDEVVSRALARSPDHRFPDADHLAAALRSAAAAPTPSPGTPVTSAPAARPPDPDATTVTARPPAVASAGPPADATPVYQPRPPRRRHWGPVVAALGLIGLAVGVLILLVLQSQSGDVGSRPSDDGRQSTDAGPLPISSVQSFDPEGDGREGDDTVARAVDGDAASTWRTEQYATRSFGNLKSGVGLVVNLEATARIDEVLIDSPTPGWSGSVYVAAAPSDSLGGWGEPVAQVGPTTGRVGIPVDAEGAAVLVWVTDLGDTEPARVEVAEISVLGT